jgi:hypothetical protein
MSPEHDAGDGDRVDHAVSPIPQHTTALEIPLGSGTHAKRTVAALIASELRSSAGQPTGHQNASRRSYLGWAPSQRRCGSCDPEPCGHHDACLAMEQSKTSVRRQRAGSHRRISIAATLLGDDTLALCAEDCLSASVTFSVPHNGERLDTRARLRRVLHQPHVFATIHH